MLTVTYTQTPPIWWPVDVLKAMEAVFADINDPRENREYRLKFPSEVLDELNSNLWGMFHARKSGVNSKVASGVETYSLF